MGGLYITIYCVAKFPLTICTISCHNIVHWLMNCLYYFFPASTAILTRIMKRLRTEKFRRSLVRDKTELQWDLVHIWRTWHGEEWAGIFLRRSLTWNIYTTYILYPVRLSAKYECNFIWNMTQSKIAQAGICSGRVVSTGD